MMIMVLYLTTKIFISYNNAFYHQKCHRFNNFFSQGANVVGRKYFDELEKNAEKISCK
jgi:hypothetical protein